VAELSTLTTDDRRRLLLPATRAARQRVTPLVALLDPQLQALAGVLPSYVLDAVTGLRESLIRWEKDEQSCAG